MKTLATLLTLSLAGFAGACASMASTPQATPPPAGPTEVNPSSESGVIPVGQELDVRLQRSLSSATARVEDRFDATTAVDLLEGGQVLVPAGSVVRGVVSGVESAGRLDRKGRISLSFDQLSMRGRTFPLRGTATQVFESGIQDEAVRIGAGAGLGAIVGGILGGAKGALVGVLVGAGGMVAATEGQDVTLPAGTLVRIRLDSPVTIR